MKKEINEMLTLGNKDKFLNINGAFILQAMYVGDDGLNVGISKKEPVDLKLMLEYTLAHDKCLFKSKEIKSRTCAEVIAEIATAMEEMWAEISAQLIRDFRNGYLLGSVKE